MERITERPETVPCHACEGEARLTGKERAVPVGRRRVTIQDEFYRCLCGGEDFYLPGMMDESQRRAAEKVREAEPWPHDHVRPGRV